ncbi:alpha/beta hydrolase [Dietzia sp.]|uniref:alpha/beta hydrolase n=1 Tax=Dietzia sp. TaxID=1871616 RepID=UPI002FDA75D5
MATIRRTNRRRFGAAATAVALSTLVAATSGLVPAAGAQSAGVPDSSDLPPASSGPAGSLDAASTIAKSSLGLIGNGSLFNSDAPVLAPLSAGTAPLSTASLSGPTGSLVTPALMGSTAAMSLIPVGSVASGAQILGALFGPQYVTQGVGSLTGPGYAVPAPNPAIDTTRITKVDPIQDDPNVPNRAELWTVHSKSMAREFQVEVFFPKGYKDDTPAPVLYYLDGVDSLNPSGYRTLTSGPRRASEAGVISVAPVGAPGSNWTEWQSDDPRLGRNKWETFLTEEFPQLMRDEKSNVKPNGVFGATGVSMGAGSALQLAGSKSDFFATAGGVSGCYSTASDLGFETLRLSIETRGGNMENMWGPRGTSEWQERDLPNHPERLASTKVFMSAATGAIGAEDAKRYGSDPSVLFSGYVLEAGTRECTNQLDRSLTSAGVEHNTYFAPTGVHNWSTFTPAFDQALDYMIPNLTGPGAKKAPGDWK